MAKRNGKPEHRSSPRKSFPTRKLKVRKGAYYYQYGDFQPRHRYRSNPPVPWVRIKGYWLNEAGFTIGTHLVVEVQTGRLVIEVQPPPN